MIYAFHLNGIIIIPHRVWILNINLRELKQTFVAVTKSQWNKLLKGAVDGPSMEVLKTRLSGGLSNLV